MELPELVMTVFHKPEAALALAPRDESVDTLAELYRQSAALARVAWNPYLYNPLLKRRLSRITAPTLLCWGEHDRLAPLICAKAWADEIPGARLVTFSDSGHVPHLEEPDAVARRGHRVLRLARGGPREVLLLPPDALRDGPRRALVVGDAVQPPLRSRGRATRSTTSTSTSSSTPRSSAGTASASTSTTRTATGPCRAPT